MTQRRSAFTGVALFLAPCILAGQPTRELGAASYTPPPGWQLTTNAGMHSMVRVKGADLCMIAVYADESLTGDTASAFTRAWTTAFTSASYASAPQPAAAERTTPTGYRHMVGESDLVDRGNNRWVARQHLFTLGDRAQAIMLVGNSRPALTSCAAEWDAFVAALRFPRFAAQAAAPSVAAAAPATTTDKARATPRGAGEITGVWSGIAMSGGDLKVHHAVFFPNGIAYFGPGFPLRGLLGLDSVSEQAAARRYWGSYTFSAGSGVLTMPYGTIPLRALGSNIELTTSRSPHRYFRLFMPDTSTIAGNWCLRTGECLRFTGGRTGRFEDAGAVRVLEHAYDAPQSPLKGAGQYELRDHTLVLRYDGGPEIRIAVPGMAAGGPTPPRELMLSFNLDVLTRQ